MKQLPMSRVTALLALFVSYQLSAQDIRTFNQNASRSNNRYLDDNWSFGINSGGSFGLKSNENSLFRGNSMATKMFGRYYFGNMGLGFTNGIMPGAINDGALNSFITDRKYPQDQLQVSNTKPFNSYFLFGPSFRFGNRVEVGADAQAGMFVNNPGGVTIGQSGAARPLYRFDGGDKSLFPGFSGSIHIAYPINHSTRFFVNSDYLQSKSSIRLYDPQQGIDVATEQNRDLKMFTAGVGIIKSFGTKRDAASGRPTGRRSRDTGSGMATGKRSARDASSGMASGRILSTDNNNAFAAPRDAASGLPTGRRTYQPGQPVYGNLTRQMENESCGPVTLTTTNPDGTSEQRIFACPADAAQYAERISMNVTVPKQTQGATFGEKVNQGLHAAGSALSQGASRGVISGTINWGNGNAHGITTNEMAAVSSVGNLAGGAGGGAAAASYARMANNTNSNAQGPVTTIYTRDAASGRPTGRRSRETGSGMATGRRQYQLVFNDGNNNECNGCAVSTKLIAHELTHVVQQSGAAKTVNPLYNETGNSGTNPRHEKTSGGGNGGTVCGSTGHFLVILINADSEQPIAKTTTDSCGNFWFANVPEGNYAVRVKSEVVVKKTYAININNNSKYDVAGEMIADDNQLSVQLTTSIDDTDNQKGKVIVRGWDPKKKESIAGTANNNEAASASLLGGAVISSAFIAGTPIGGIIVKGGKNPGGQMRTTQTNEYGEFEFTDLEKGSYTISTELKYTVDETIAVSLSENNGEANERKGWDGTIKGGSKAQDHNSTRSNKTASVIENDNDNTNERKGWDGTVKGGNKAQDHNSTRSNKTASVIENDYNNGESNKLKAQNINTVRSNRTELKSILVEADTDGDGNYETDVTNKVNDEVTLDENGNIIAPQQKAGISTSRSNIRTRSSLQETGEGLYISYGNSVIDNKETAVRSILKTKHDTAKNSVGNIR